MQSFEEIYATAAKRHGGPAALEKLLSKPKSKAALRKIGDDRYLSGMTKSVFMAGFSWKVIERKWPNFEAAFFGFAPRRVAFMPDEALDALLQDRGIVRNGPKIRATRDNARFIVDLAEEHGSAAKFFADWPSDDYVGLLALLKKRASRLGGTSAQYFLRFIGKDAFVLSKSVVAALKAQAVVDKDPTSKRDLRAVQDAFNAWSAESGRPITQVSQVLARSTDG